MIETKDKGKEETEQTLEEVNCTVLFGYGKVAPTYKNLVDGYQFVGGVGKNIPKSVAENWKNGLRSDGKPSGIRLRMQAVLPEIATEVDYVKATGVVLMPPNELAAMVNATDAATLVKSLGRKRAVELAEELLKNSGS